MPFWVLLFGLEVVIEEVEDGKEYTRSNFDEKLIGVTKTLEDAKEMRADWMRENSWTD